MGNGNRPTPEEQEIIRLVREQLTDSMREDRYRELNIHDMCGHCRHAAIAVRELLGGKDAGYKLQKAWDGKVTHFWVLGPEDRILDPTVDQYTDLKRDPPYAGGTGQGCRPVSADAKTIVAAVRAQQGRQCP